MSLLISSEVENEFIFDNVTSLEEESLLVGGGGSEFALVTVEFGMNVLCVGWLWVGRGVVLVDQRQNLQMQEGFALH